MFWWRQTFTDVFDNTFDISDFRAHIFCPQTTQELANKHHEATEDRLNNNCLLMHCHKSITYTLDTVEIACANEWRIGQFGKFE